MEPQLSAERAYNTSKEANGERVDSLLGGSALNYVGHRVCVRRESAATRRERKHVELAELARHKDLVDVQDRNLLHRSTSSEAWLSSVPHRINGTEVCQE